MEGQPLINIIIMVLQILLLCNYHQNSATIILSPISTSTLPLARHPCNQFVDFGTRLRNHFPLKLKRQGLVARMKLVILITFWAECSLQSTRSTRGMFRSELEQLYN